MNYTLKCKAPLAVILLSLLLSACSDSETAMSDGEDEATVEEAMAMAGGGEAGVASLVKLLDLGTSVDSVNKQGISLLMFAAEGGSLDAVSLLISRQADLNLIAPSGVTALMYAAAGGFSDIVNVLVAAGANIHPADPSGMTALAYAARDGRVEAVNALLGHGADVNVLFSKFETALGEAAKQGNLELAKLLIQNGATLEPFKKNGETPATQPLIQAAIADHQDMVAFLLASGADMETSNFQGKGVLVSTLMEGKPDMAKYLLDRGANPGNDGFIGYTPLMIAVENEYVEIVDILLAKGVDLDVVEGGNGNTAVSISAQVGNVVILEKLLGAGAELSIASDKSNIPFLHACVEGHTDMMEFLLDRGADINSTDAAKRNCLHHAIESGKTDVLP
ncbi:MAG TPA: ankyrin repeat domain-containing protein, partial [Chromatiaceae bacterium]|nr:ankyrin repeat domain-containing protein [Chromatiaceae bacterium]